jgi:type IV pilus assembly protein PilM
VKVDRFIALDIGTDYIRMGVFARHSASQVELVDYGDAGIDSDSAAGMAREAVVAMALKRLLDERKPTVRKTVLSIEGQAVFSRLVKLPPVAPERLAQTIRHEAVQNIPFPIDEVVWDAHVVNPADSAPEILLVAVKAELVGGLVDAVAANGLLVERVGVAPAALANAVRFARPTLGVPCLLVDTGGYSVNLVFIDGERTFFRTLPVAGGVGPRLVQEIERSIAFYRGQQAGNAPRRILLAGGLAHLDEAESRLGIPVEAFDPLESVQQSVVVAGGGNLAVLAGMAMCGSLEINLVPEALEKVRRFRRMQPLLLASVSCLILIAGIWIWGLTRLARLARTETGEVRERVEALEKTERQLIPLEERIDALQETAEVFRLAMDRRSFWLEALAEIRRCLADGMFLLASEPLRNDEAATGLRITVVSYLDKETAGEDAIILLRDRLRACVLFSDETSVFNRPTKRQFARQFVLDVVFAEGAE